MEIRVSWRQARNMTSCIGYRTGQQVTYFMLYMKMFGLNWSLNLNFNGQIEKRKRKRIPLNHNKSSTKLRSKGPIPWFDCYTLPCIRRSNSVLPFLVSRNLFSISNKNKGNLQFLFYITISRVLNDKEFDVFWLKFGVQFLWMKKITLKELSLLFRCSIGLRLQIYDNRQCYLNRTKPVGSRTD